MMKQKEAVFAAVVSVLGSFEGAANPTKEQRGQVFNIVREGFTNGTIALDKTYETESELNQYTSGVISNWLRKDVRLNGGTKYSAKNPGSRTGASDPQLKALRGLLSTKTDDAERSEIQSFIDARVAEIAATKVKSKPIDVASLPTALQAKYGN